LGIVAARQPSPRSQQMATSDRYDGLELVQPTPTGDIYRASHTVLGRPVLIRTLDQRRFDSSEMEAIKSAVTATAQLVHPNILSVIDAEFGDDMYYVTDNVIDSLKDRMEGSPFERADVASWGLQLLRGIAHAHAHDVIHRGISPWRIHFDQVGTVLIADFGLTTVIKDKTTGMVSVEADAMAYLPMGVLRRPASYTKQADRYGIAALICELMTGVVPESTTIPVRRAKGEVPDHVVEGLAKLLTGQGTDEDMAAAIDSFKRWVDNSGPSKQPVRPPSSSTATSRAAIARAAQAAESRAREKKEEEESPAEKVAKPATAPKKATDRETRRSATNKTTTRARSESKTGAQKQASPVAPAAAKTALKPDDMQTAAKPEVPASADADRVEDKLNKYAELFAD
jgi:serine/threonine protein kinase